MCHQTITVIHRLIKMKPNPAGERYGATIYIFHWYAVRQMLVFAQLILGAVIILSCCLYHNCTPGDTPYIRMIGMIVVFLGVAISDLVFFRVCPSEIY